MTQFRLNAVTQITMSNPVPTKNGTKGSNVTDGGATDTISSLLNTVDHIGPGDTIKDVDLGKLLKEIEAADNVAQGVEGKLDSILANLESMLQGLEEKDRVLPAKSQAGESEPSKRD